VETDYFLSIVEIPGIIWIKNAWYWFILAAVPSDSIKNNFIICLLYRLRYSKSPIFFYVWQIKTSHEFQIIFILAALIIYLIFIDLMFLITLW